MISQLSIKDFAIIKQLKTDFQQGLNILTGETGSGKSIIIEAISLALGSRADTTYIRTGCDKAVIQLVLDVPAQEEPIILSREILSTGKSASSTARMSCTVEMPPPTEKGMKIFEATFSTTSRKIPRASAEAVMS